MKFRILSLTVVTLFACSDAPPTEWKVTNGHGNEVTVPLSINGMDTAPVKTFVTNGKGAILRGALGFLNAYVKLKIKEKATWKPLRMVVEPDTHRAGSVCAYLEGVAKNALGVDKQITVYKSYASSKSGGFSDGPTGVIEGHGKRCPLKSP